MISVQKNVQQKGGITNHELETIFESIRTGGKLKNEILRLRDLRINNKPQYDIEKKQTPGIIFQGVFSDRKKEGLITSSGLMILDFDHTGIELKEKLKELDFIYVAFVSLGGDGFFLYFSSGVFRIYSGMYSSIFSCVCLSNLFHFFSDFILSAFLS